MSGPAVLLLLLALRALDFFGTGFSGDVACDYFWLCGYVFGSCGFSEVTGNLVDGDVIS
jgi:hypothetical protein